MINKNLIVLRIDGGISSQIAFFSLGHFLKEKGYQVKYDTTWFKECSKDCNGVFARNYDMDKAFPDLEIDFATEEEIKYYSEHYPMVTSNIKEFKAPLDLFLMSQCKHIIGSKGSFGYFAKILSSNEDGYFISFNDNLKLSRKLKNTIVIGYDEPEEEFVSIVISTSKKINYSLLEYIFSVKNDYNKKHKIITILGIKIKIKSKSNSETLVAVERERERERE